MKKRNKGKEKKLNSTLLITILVLFCCVLLSLGFSSFQANLDISGIGAYFRIQKDIRITNISASSFASSAYTNWEEFNVSNINASIVLPNQNSTVTYDIPVINVGNVEMGILDITGLPNNLTYSISNYNLKDTLCDDTNTNQCKLGSTTTLQVTIGYAPNGYNSSNITYNVNMDFDFRQVYSLNYVGFSNTSSLPSTILDGETKNITFTNSTGIPADTTVTNASATYSSPTLTLSNASDNVVVTRKFSVTYVDFTGDTSGLISRIGPEGGTIAFNSTTGIPEFVLVSGAIGNYNSTNNILTISDVTSNVVVTMATDGNVEIVSISRTDISNVTENNAPVITSDGQGITFDLGVTVNQSNYNQDFFIKYAIDINNDSVSEQKLLATNFTPRIVGSGNVPNVTYTITDANGNQVLNSTIPPKTTETYYLTINIYPQEQGSWGVEGETSVDTVKNGIVSGSIDGSNQGNLTGSNTTAHFVASVVNSFDETKSFTLSIDDNRFSIVDSNGNAISAMSITANTTDTYDFYIKNNNGNNFMSSPCDLNVNINYDSNVSSIGVLSLSVDVDPSLTDSTPPVINNVTATITSTQKEIRVSWSGYDDNPIDKYYLQIYSSDGNNNDTFIDEVTINGAANNTVVNYTVTVPTDDTYYFFKVYGEDRAQAHNKASASDISGCSPSSGYCSKTTTEKYKWNFEVTLVLTNATSTNGTTTTNNNVRTVKFNVPYDGNINTTLNGAGNDYNSPSSISSATITYANGTTSNLRSGSSSQTAYNYNTNSHVLNVYHVIGDITIEASGVQTQTCLAEGTKILLANGSSKNIEDIGYDDLLAVWNYDTGELTYEYPLWIESEHISDQVTRVTFSDHSYIDFVGNHAIYNSDIDLFVNILDNENFKIGTHVAKIKNNKLVNVSVTNIETIYKKVKYYFVGSTTYYNIFANNILTTDRTLMISNLYGFDKNAKWPKEKHQILANKNNLLDYSYFEDVLPYYLYKGFRVQEAGYLINNKLVDLDTFKKYIYGFIINPSMITPPITKNNDRYWMVTTSEDIITENNKEKYLKKEGSKYKVPKINKKNFKGWLNTADNLIYKPGDKIVVSHGIHLKAVYDTKLHFEKNLQKKTNYKILK